MLVPLRNLLVIVCLLWVPAASRAAAGDAESDAYAWIQYAADGRPHIRVIPSDRAACPPVTADGLGVAASLTVTAAAGFDRVLCDGAVPAGARSVHVGSLALPPVPRHIARFVVLGDTGCRITAAEIQNCRDARAWPFARIAQAIARESPRPDLIVHVGDSNNREAPCPANDARCAGSPYGDNWSTWAVDLFEPGAPLFATAPLVWVRGDNESCRHGGVGWSRYLAPDPEPTCRIHDDPVSATFDDLRLINVDSSPNDEMRPDPAKFERVADSAAQGRETFFLTHRPPLADLAVYAAAAPIGPHVAAIIAGYGRHFALVSFAGAPPAIIVGTGGGTLATTTAPELSATVPITTEARFGYVVFDRAPGGWSISERAPDGSEYRRCELRARTVHC